MNIYRYKSKHFFKRYFIRFLCNRLNKKHSNQNQQQSNQPQNPLSTIFYTRIELNSLLQQLITIDTMFLYKIFWFCFVFLYNKYAPHALIWVQDPKPDQHFCRLLLFGIFLSLLFHFSMIMINNKQNMVKTYIL